MTKPSGTDLQSDSKTLWYEFNQMCGAADVLRTAPSDEITHNALVESFVVHVRALGHFFFAGKDVFPALRKDDVGATNFISSWQVTGPMPSQLLIDAKTDGDKEIAHMTKKRRELNFSSGKNSIWLIDQIEAELLGILQMFLNCVPSSHLDPQAEVELRRLACPRPVPGQTWVSSGLKGSTSLNTTSLNTISRPNRPDGPHHVSGS